MAGNSDSGVVLSCRCRDYQSILQQSYTFLESKLDSKNGLVSEMFQRQVISFSEKKAIERILDNFERNREIIDLFFEKKTFDHYSLFLDCLRNSGQSHIRNELEFGCTCPSASKNPPSEMLAHSKYRGELEQVGKIVLDEKLAVIGICCMNGFIYTICHMDCHIFVHLAMPPYFRLTFQEFDLPVTKGQFHFYDMACCPEENFLIVSDKANQCLWFINVSSKSASFQLIEGHPMRMSVSSFSTHCSDDEGYEDIYGENCFSCDFVEKDAQKDLDDKSSSACQEVVTQKENFDPARLVEKLLVEKLSVVDGKRYDSSMSCATVNRVDTNYKKTLLVVVKNKGQHCVNFYVNDSSLKFLNKISLLLDDHHSVSNAIQKRDDGHVFICYGRNDFDSHGILPWYLGEYLPSGEMLRSFLASSTVWIPRYITVDDSGDWLIYSISRFSGKIVKLRQDLSSRTVNVSSVSTVGEEFQMPSRVKFFHLKMDNGNNEEFLVVGLGEIKRAHPPASILIFRKLHQ